ncbi:MAG: hypothetical protein LCH43_11305 [Actinobacteria bacterium]|nr:hypothetical protein [Actinomycetota bacterium]
MFSTNRLTCTATRPLLPSRPRLRFVDGAPDGGGGDNPKPTDPKPTDDPKPPAPDAPESEWKAYARLWETRAKAKPDITPAELKQLQDKAKQFDEAEEANKTALQKAEDRAKAAEAKVAERDAADAAAKLVAEVAKAKGVPASALRGTTKEEIEAHADELLTHMPAKPETPSADGQGEQGKPIGEGEMSAEDIVKAATAR